MSKLFYDHLINLQKIHEKLEEYDLSAEEKKELMRTIDTTIHHEVMNVILTHLPREHHEEFLEEFAKEPHHERHLIYIQEKTPEEVDMEQEIGKIEEILLAEMVE